jgi:hypothetical protein
MAVGHERHGRRQALKVFEALTLSSESISTRSRNRSTRSSLTTYQSGRCSTVKSSVPSSWWRWRSCCRRASDCAAFVSFDGGRTWARHNFGVAGCADPWVALREDGTALFAGLSMARGNEMQLPRSADGGRTWASVPLDLGRVHDHETMIVDTTTGPHAGSIYLVSNGSWRGRSAGLRQNVSGPHLTELPTSWQIMMVSWSRRSSLH